MLSLELMYMPVENALPLQAFLDPLLAAQDLQLTMGADKAGHVPMTALPLPWLPPGWWMQAIITRKSTPRRRLPI